MATGIQFVLAHALYLAHIHGGKNKNDRVDSEKLAHLLRTNLIPPAYVYPAERRPMRALLRQRTSYVWRRAELLAHVSTKQSAEGLVPAAKSGHNRDVWEEQILAQYANPLHKFGTGCDMEVVRAYDRQIDRLDLEVVRQAKKHLGRDYQLLLTVPGIGQVLGLTILFEMDAVTRFPTAKNFLSYCRLVKGSVASAGKVKGLCGGKMGNAYLRWAFGEAAVIAKRNHPLLEAVRRAAGGQARQVRRQRHPRRQDGPRRLPHARERHRLRRRARHRHLDLTFARTRMSPKFRTGKPIFQSVMERTRILGPASPMVLVDGMTSPVPLNGPSRRGHLSIASSEQASAPDPNPPITGRPGFGRAKPAFLSEWVAPGLTAVEFWAAAGR